jgi:hypothetical protein
MSNIGFRPRRAGINDNNARRMLWRAIAACALGMVVAATGLAAQERDRYREFQLRSDVATVLAITGVQTPEVKFIHQRPAVIQQLRWRPRYAVTRSSGAEANATEQMVFTFYNDQLFRVTVEYDSERTKGLTDRDMTEAISAVYGSEVSPTLSRTRPTPALYEEESGTPVARWGDARDSLMLYRSSSYATRFRLIMTAEPLAALARTAAARAGVLDDREAPQREAAREKQEADDRRAAEEKARSANKAIFRP